VMTMRARGPVSSTTGGPIVRALSTMSIGRSRIVSSGRIGFMAIWLLPSSCEDLMSGCALAADEVVMSARGSAASVPGAGDTRDGLGGGGISSEDDDGAADADGDAAAAAAAFPLATGALRLRGAGRFTGVSGSGLTTDASGSASSVVSRTVSSIMLGSVAAAAAAADRDTAVFLGLPRRDVVVGGGAAEAVEVSPVAAAAAAVDLLDVRPVAAVLRVAGRFAEAGGAGVKSSSSSSSGGAAMLSSSSEPSSSITGRRLARRDGRPDVVSGIVLLSSRVGL
jgi:hypothetical protein